MTKPKGGRGLKAEYPTKMVRVPIVLEQHVKQAVEALYSGDLVVKTDYDSETLQPIYSYEHKANSGLPDKQAMIAIANDLLTKSKLGGKKLATKLIQVFYSDSNITL